MKQQKFNQLFSNLIRSKAQLTDSDLLDQIKDGAKISVKRAFEVYQEDYQARLSGALKNNYPAINSIIGDVIFEEIASDYNNSYPSISSDLDDYGHKFSFFLSTQSISKDYLFLAELADFEWNFREVFHLKQELGAGAAQLSEMLNEEVSTIRLVKSARLLSYNYTITSLFALKDNEEILDNFKFMEPQFVIIFKNELLVKFQVLSKHQWMILKNTINPSLLIEIINNAPTDITHEDMKNLFKYFGTDRLLLKLNL